MSKSIPKVHLVYDDIDRHGAGCDCGLCNANGKSYGVAIHAQDHRVIQREYAPSIEAAFHNARLVCKLEGFEIVIKDETTNCG